MPAAPCDGARFARCGPPAGGRWRRPRPPTAPHHLPPKRRRPANETRPARGHGNCAVSVALRRVPQDEASSFGSRVTPLPSSETRWPPPTAGRAAHTPPTPVPSIRPRGSPPTRPPATMWRTAGRRQSLHTSSGSCTHPCSFPCSFAARWRLPEYGSRDEVVEGSDKAPATIRTAVVPCAGAHLRPGRAVAGH